MASKRDSRLLRRSSTCEVFVSMRINGGMHARTALTNWVNSSGLVTSAAFPSSKSAATTPRPRPIGPVLVLLLLLDVGTPPRVVERAGEAAADDTDDFAVSGDACEKDPGEDPASGLTAMAARTAKEGRPGQSARRVSISVRICREL